MSKKYLFLINTLNVGGAETGLVDLANAIAEKDGYTVEILLTLKTGPLLDNLSDKIVVKSLLDKKKPFKSIWNAGIISLTLLGIPANSFMFKGKYDYIVSYLEGYPSLFASNLKAKAKVASIRVGLRDHQTALDKLPWGKRLQIKMYQKFDRIHTVSLASKEEFIEKYPLNVSNTKEITTGFDIEGILQKGNESNPFNNSNKVQIVTVGRIEEQKGYDILFESVYQLSLKRNDFQVNLVGNTETEFANKLRNVEHYSKLIEDNILVLQGVQSNPYKFMKNADFILTTSRYEGFPRVVNESLVLNKFIVASDIAPNKESMHNDGILVPLNVDAYVSTLEGVLSNKPYKGYNVEVTVKSKDLFTSEFIAYVEED